MYKYTRKECNKEIETIKRIFSGSQIMPGGWLETVAQYLHATQLMLLAKKEDKKEWKPCDCPKGGIDGDGMVCDKCGGTEWVNVKSTPSLLEIEEIKEMKVNKLSYASYNQWAKIMNKINSLISNQKKLYQFIKEKL